jgi:hypothetical protein
MAHRGAQRFAVLAVIALACMGTTSECEDKRPAPPPPARTGTDAPPATYNGHGVEANADGSCPDGKHGQYGYHDGLRYRCVLFYGEWRWKRAG